jgi:hypothetical protein
MRGNDSREQTSLAVSAPHLAKGFEGTGWVLVLNGARIKAFCSPAGRF